MAAMNTPLTTKMHTGLRLSATTDTAPRQLDQVEHELHHHLNTGSQSLDHRLPCPITLISLRISVPPPPLITTLPAKHRKP